MIGGCRSEAWLKNVTYKRRNDAMTRRRVRDGSGKALQYHRGSASKQRVSGSLPCVDVEPAECRIFVKTMWILRSPFASPPERLRYGMCLK
ncbi:hypothetical protein YC2023_066837 [Brassica napus]